MSPSRTSQQPLLSRCGDLGRPALACPSGVPLGPPFLPIQSWQSSGPTWGLDGSRAVPGSRAARLTQSWGGWTQTGVEPQVPSKRYHGSPRSRGSLEAFHVGLRCFWGQRWTGLDSAFPPEVYEGGRFKLCTWNASEFSGGVLQAVAQAGRGLVSEAPAAADPPGSDSTGLIDPSVWTKPGGSSRFPLPPPEGLLPQ